MASTQVRYATIVRFKALFEANSLSAWTETPERPHSPLLWLGYPGKDNLGAEDAYIVRSDGLHSPDTFSPRRSRLDDFNVTIELQAAIDGQSDLVAYQRVEQLFAFFEDAAADHQANLADADGTAGIDGLKKAFISRVDGPFVINENVGWRGYLNFDLSCLAQYV